MPDGDPTPTPSAAGEPGPTVTASAEPVLPEPAAVDSSPFRRGGNGSVTEPASPPLDPTQTASTKPANSIGPVGVVGQVLTAAAQEIVRVVRPEAAVAVAAEFGFPLALAAAVLGFLLIQGYVDRRDPKLRMAPETSFETIIQFKPEEQL